MRASHSTIRFSVRKSEGSRSKFAPTDAAASAAISRREFIVKDPSETGLKPGDSSQDNVSKEKSKNILGAPFAISCEGERSRRCGKEIERERKRSRGWPLLHSRRAKPHHERQTHGDGEERRGGEESGGRTRAREAERDPLERNGEERPALL